ncbi:GNAT family N-acetyltransferase [Gracilimonas sp.]|uniref:GNAT family N-acetyltransferase n=1 Tax=Gracilimonas sp. TaxID=1974203 RepID=UPI0032EEF42A
MKKHYQIRTIRRDELDRLTKLCELHAEYEKAEYFSEGKANKLEEAIFGKNKKIECWVITKANYFIGYVTLIPQFSTWDAENYLYLDCLFIKEGHRGQGIGAKVMKKIHNFASSNGYSQVQWQTPSFNEGAIKFYNREGAIGKQKVRFTLNISEN